MGAERSNLFTKWLGKPQSLRRGQIKFIWAVFLPIVFLFVIIRVIPILSNFGLSLTNASFMRPVTKFIALKNFFRLFTDTLSIKALFNSLEFVIISVPAKIILGLLFAILLTRKFQGRRIKYEGLFQTLYFVPYILPMVPTIIIWRWFYNPGNFGLANHLLSLLGLPKVQWMSNPDILLLVIIGIHTWKNLGYFVLVFLVALKGVPKDLMDAAKIDGANEWQTITQVELPIIRPLLLFGTVMATIASWSAFTEVFTMSQGTDVSTGAEIQVLMYRMYQEMFSYSNIGKGSTIAVIIFLASVLLIFVVFKLFHEKER